jgi:predicted transcriptional regulator
MVKTTIRLSDETMQKLGEIQNYFQATTTNSTIEEMINLQHTVVDAIKKQSEEMTHTMLLVRGYVKNNKYKQS